MLDASADFRYKQRILILPQMIGKDYYYKRFLEGQEVRKIFIKSEGQEVRKILRFLEKLKV